MAKVAGNTKRERIKKKTTQGMSEFSRMKNGKKRSRGQGSRRRR